MNGKKEIEENLFFFYIILAEDNLWLLLDK